MQKATVPWNTKQIHKMMGNGSIIFDNAIQRGFVWDKKRMSLLIDSILRGYPIPPFYTIKDGRTVTTPKGEVSVYDCLDGKQRCNTITKFKNNEFKLTGLDEITLEDGSALDLNGLTYDELPEELRDVFDSYSLTVYFFTDITEEEIVEMMARLNNGKPLGVVENTRIKAKDLSGIQELAKHPLFMDNLSENALNKYHNEDIVIKTYIQLTSDEPCLDNHAVRPVFESLEMTPEIKERLGDIFTKLDAIHAELVNRKQKAIAKKVITKTHLISLTKIIDRSIADGYDIDTMTNMIEQFFVEGSPSTNEEYNAACKDGSNHTNNVITRLSVLDAEYDWYFGGNESENQTEE